MLSIVKLSRAWFDARGWSLAEGISFLEIDQARAVAAGAADACPQCDRPNTEHQGWAFEADPATANSEHEHGRAYVLCICGAMYWYAAVDVLDEPNSEARVRAASALRPAATEPLPPGTNNTLDAANQVASQFRPEHYVAIQAQIDNSHISSMLVHRAHEQRRPRFYETSSSFVLPPFGPLRARHPAS